MLKAPLLTERAMAVVLPVAAWCCYGQVGLKYIGWLAATALAVVVLQQRESWRVAWAQPGMTTMLLFSGWLLLSASWSPAPARDLVAHAWVYVLPPTALLIAAGSDPRHAASALRHFVWASAAVGLLLVLHTQLQLPLGIIGTSTATALGNQRITTSVLLALGAAIACSLWLQEGTLTKPEPAPKPAPAPAPLADARSQHDAGKRRRVLLIAAAAACLLGLASQDRRTGMLLLPLLLLGLALAAARSWRLRLGLVVLVLAGGAAVWTASDTVRARFAEGWAELGALGTDTALVTSWGQRAWMLEHTAEMVRQRPLVGHGLGSWRGLLREQTVIGTALWDNSTPHNEYLGVAAQAGIPAALLFAAWLARLMVTAWRNGRPGLPALMVWLAMALCGLASAVLRDTKLALPLLMLAGLAGAAMRRTRP